jgi:hypothetical protein
VLEHDGRGAGRRLLSELQNADVDVQMIRASHVPDLPLRLRKIGDAPGRMPGALLALARGRYDLAHALTPQDAVVAIAWSRLAGRPAVFTQRDPLTRANVADRRLRLAMLRVALESSDAIVAPDREIAESLRRWMAVDPLVVPLDSGAGHLGLYSELTRR